ncbi:Inulin fructotransferase [DFA-I-forming] [Clarias magur]|uniref:Inulin fructotransferase [DFA-I-forming] n=1 Tax=Clarias magur TaxID=1594786 RepID=A0A8J4UUX4_CLAMG|nr:Inulin fructotransferase [DFA-I-forming] [Clarias magur]
MPGRALIRPGMGEVTVHPGLTGQISRPGSQMLCPPRHFQMTLFTVDLSVPRVKLHPVYAPAKATFLEHAIRQRKNVQGAGL